ncbi:MAG TPA: carboxy terminal-processing peptidase [Steroidobacteraceae bacterium]|nr:carboxy terminal-processing peptidase [Steroidobacteraceae bacterium]
MTRADNRLRRFLAPFALGAACLLLLAATASTNSQGSVQLPEGAIRPTPRQQEIAQQVASNLEQYHYSRRPIDKDFSAQVFDRYLNSLDGQHSYFLAADVAAMAQWRSAFDDMIHTGRLEPAYLMFARLQQRNRERIEYALSLLATEPDWTLNERYTFDRDKAPWPRDAAELNELWRQRVKSDALSLMLTGKSWPETADILRKRYQRVLARVNQVSTDDVFESLMNAYASVYDPHTSYLAPRSAEEFRIQMSLSYEGIGASLQLVDDYVTIGSLLPGGPAAAANTLKPNDRIMAVGQGNDGAFTDVVGWRLDDVVQLIRGKGGTLVRLQVLPAGAAPGSELRTVALTRGKITLENQAVKQEARAIQVGDRTLHVGIITVPGFYEDNDARNAGDPNFRTTSRDVRRAIGELQAKGPIDALLLDLRGDGGGFLPEAIALSGLFIDQGPIVQLRHTDGSVEHIDDPEPGVAYSGPLAVLVDRTSASASEIFAAAMQDYHRGLVLGQTTFGKGTVQQVIPLDHRWSAEPSGGQLNVTFLKFYRVTGESTQLHGVQPDIELPARISTKDVGEGALESPLPWDRIAPVPFRADAPLGPVVQTIAKEQSQHEAHDADYQWLVGALAALEQDRADHSLSLNLAERQRERAAEEQQALARENVRRAADGLAPLKSLSDSPADGQPDVIMAEAARIAAELAIASSSAPAASTTATAAARR